MFTPAHAYVLEIKRGVNHFDKSLRDWNI